MLTVVARHPAFDSRPATTVLPVVEATVNFPEFTSTSPATSSVLDSVVAPAHRRVARE